MKTRINSLLADVIKSFLAKNIQEHQPSLNCEFDMDSQENTVDLLVEAVQNWEANHILFCSIKNNKPCIEIVEKSAIREIILNHLNGDVVSIIDPISSCGITFDFTSGNKQSFHVTGWGVYENVPKFFSEKIVGSVLFRGN